MDYLSTKEAAIRLRISPRRVRALIQSGRLSAIRVGGVWAIALSDVEAFSAIARCPGWKRGKKRK